MDAVILKVGVDDDFKQALKDSFAEMNRVIAESDAKIAESRRETDAKIAASDAKIAESRRETDARIADSRREMDARFAATLDAMKDLDSKVGNRIGDLTEKILMPGLKLAMRNRGHVFTSLSPNREFDVEENGITRRLTEVDLYLENGIESMAVEVKTQMRKEDVERHLWRLDVMRKHEDITALRGKTLLGAMAGLDILVEAREFALKSGLYLIEMIESEKYVKVVEPPAGVPQAGNEEPRARVHKLKSKQGV